MQKLYSDFTAIIKASLTNTDVTLSDDLDYKSIFTLSVKHKMVPLILNGLYKLKGNIPELDAFKRYTFQFITFDQNLLNCLNKIESAFADNGIDYMLLKGASVKKLYPSSEYRLMGDADILIKESQYEKIKELLSTLGLREYKESDHEFIWIGDNKIVIELHKRLIPSYNDDYYAYYSNPWSKAVYGYNHSFSMSKEDEYIYLFTHFTKHYRDGSVMLRPFIDLWLFANKYPLMNKHYIDKELEALELKAFHDNIVKTIDVWFNDAQSTELTDFITEQVLASDPQARTIAANAARQSARTDSVASAKYKEILRLVFLPMEDMKKKFPILEKFPVLLPVMWVVRWINALFNSKRTIEIEKNKLSQMDEQIVDDYNADLAKVGLKFNLKKK